MTTDQPTLAAELAHALESRGITIDELSVKTKVPRTTLRALFGHDDLVVLPGRVYLRAHLRLVIDELRMDADRTLALFDRAYPLIEDVGPAASMPRFSPGAVAVAAGLTGIGLLAIVLSVVTA